MADRILTLRELNRTTLARQLLLARETLTVEAAVARLVGMQAQLASAPFVGLWTRLADFRRDDLASAIERRSIIKATLMRATLHLFTVEDYLRLRQTVQPALDAAFASIAKQRGDLPDIAKLLTLARDYIAEQPRSFADISAHFAELMPDEDIGTIRYAIRTHLPLIQVPVAKGWCYPGNPEFTLAETWLGQAPAEADQFDELILRYLAAFGPASITDMQKWSYMTKLKDRIEALRPQLTVYRDEGKRELFDLPDLPVLDGATPVPVRFLPEYDNLLLAHDKRTRVVADAYRKGVYLPGLRVAATFLIDGFVRGAWKVEKAKGTATLVLDPFEPLAKADRQALTEEGERLVRFVEADAKAYAVRIEG
ncbi:MAG: AlkZ family DNA glycosylase [Anaerolineae bacterium]|nr:AlkZ family DNA glycosylase [Anaerolineae bacterium]